MVLDADEGPYEHPSEKQHECKLEPFHPRPIFFTFPPQVLQKLPQVPIVLLIDTVGALLVNVATPGIFRNQDCIKRSWLRGFLAFRAVRILRGFDQATECIERLPQFFWHHVLPHVLVP
jgi:hypothetical protein